MTSESGMPPARREPELAGQTNTAVTGATFDVDGGQQLVEG